MFMAVLFTTAKTWKQPKCPLMGEWIKKMWHTHTQNRILFSLKKNGHSDTLEAGRENKKVNGLRTWPLGRDFKKSWGRNPMNGHLSWWVNSLRHRLDAPVLRSYMRKTYPLAWLEDHWDSHKNFRKPELHLTEDCACRLAPKAGRREVSSTGLLASSYCPPWAPARVEWTLYHYPTPCYGAALEL